MFPGFFSHNASEGHYFARPEFYDRDRQLFKRFIPFCKLVAEAGWEPVTEATSSDEHIYIERFGKKFLTIFNDSAERRTAAITIEREGLKMSRELLSGQMIQWHNRQAVFTLDSEDVAVIQLD